MKSIMDEARDEVERKGGLKTLRRVIATKRDTERKKEMTDPKYMRPGLGFAQGKAIEEAGEFLAAMGKTQRWGWDSFNPELPISKRETNAVWVRRELKDLREALDNLEAEMNSAKI